MTLNPGILYQISRMAEGGGQNNLFFKVIASVAVGSLAVMATKEIRSWFGGESTHRQRHNFRELDQYLPRDEHEGHHSRGR